MTDVELSSMGGRLTSAAGGCITDGPCLLAEGADDNKFSVFGLSVLTAGAESKRSDRVELCV